jgi:hypothetical protein
LNVPSSRSVSESNIGPRDLVGRLGCRDARRGARGD